VVVAIQPNTGQVRGWVDSVCVLAGQVTSFPFNWVQTGQIAYASITGAEVISELDGFELQIPRHFNECAAVAPTPPVAFCPVLYRAAIATHLATSQFPFIGGVENVDLSTLLFRAARASDLATSEFPFLGDD
jgi:hypothetical protein